MSSTPPYFDGEITHVSIPVGVVRQRRITSGEIDSVEVLLSELASVDGVEVARGGAAWLEAHGRLRTFAHRHYEQGQRAGALASKELETALAESKAMQANAELGRTESHAAVRRLAGAFLAYRRGELGDSDAADAISEAIS